MDNKRDLMYQQMDNAAKMELMGLNYFNNAEVCRLCLAKIPQNGPGQSKPKPVSSLVQDINYSLNIFIAQENFCTKVCAPCSANVRKFAKFKKLCTRADEKFRKLVQNSTNVKPCKEIKIENVKLEPAGLNIKKETSDEFFEGHEASQDSSDNEIPLLTPQTKSKNKLKVKKTLDKVAKKEINTFNCDICDLTYPSKSDLTKHNLETHGQENNLYKCCGCTKAFKGKLNRRNHELYFCHSLKDGFLCQECNSLLSSRTELEEHKYNHANNIPVLVKESPRFECSECSESFGIEARLTKHMERHSTTKKYVCETCGRAFAKKDYLDKHTDIHAGVRRHHCPHCDFSARQVSGLVIHIRKHTGERPYKCDLCPLSCLTSSNLLAHRKRHLGIKQYQCTICGKQFSYKASMDVHVSLVHGRHKNFLCSVCGTTYTRRQHLRLHWQAKHPGLSWDSAIATECSICGKQFGYKDSLEQHISIIHGQHKNSSCPLCGASYIRKRHLIRHFQTKHAGVSWQSVLKMDKNAENSTGDSVGEKSDVTK